MSIVVSLALSAEAADYDCDGYDDLVVGVVGEDSLAGGIQILSGGASGITTVDTWRPATHALVGASYGFGSSLGSADLDGNGCDELAAGSRGALFVRTYVPPNPIGGEWFDRYADDLLGVVGNETLVTAVVGGAPYGTSDRFLVGAVVSELVGDLSYPVDEGVVALSDSGPGSPFQGVQHSQLAVGDFDGDGYDDFVAGDDDGDGTGIDVYYGGVYVRVSPDETVTPSTLGQSLETGDYFGHALAIGDFDGDGYDDLAIGAPGENGVGAVTIVDGDSSGLDTGSSRVLFAGTAGVAGTTGDWGWFGGALVTADFNGDGYDDLAIGAFHSDYYVVDAGAVHVLYGASGGLSTSNDQIWGQNTVNFEGVSAGGDQFGYALAAGDYNGDGYDDLAIGVRNETADAGNVAGAGAVNLLYGTASRLSVTGDKLITQNSSGIDDLCEVGDHFGETLH